MIICNGDKVSIYNLKSMMKHKAGNIVEYHVNLVDEVIDVKCDYDTGRKKDYGKYNSIVSKIQQYVLRNYYKHSREEERLIRHMTDKTSLSFLDEIQYVGLLYVDTIETKTSLEMPKQVVTNYNDQDIRDDYERMRRIFSESSLSPMNRDERNLHWNEYDPDLSQKLPYLSYLQLLGLFIRPEHKILICEENIERLLKEMKQYRKDIDISLDKAIELILLHEFGHSVFQYVGNSPIEPIMNETRANYFASTIMDGRHDPFIKELTSIQPFIYRFPILSILYMVVSSYRGNNDYQDTIREYNDMVGALYGV